MRWRSRRRRSLLRGMRGRVAPMQVLQPAAAPHRSHLSALRHHRRACRQRRFGGDARRGVGRSRRHRRPASARDAGGVRHRSRAGPRRHGRRVLRARPRARPEGRDQGDVARAGAGRGHDRAVQAGGHHRRPAASPEHRVGVFGAAGRGPALLRDAVRAGAVARAGAPAGAPAAAADRAVHPVSGRVRAHLRPPRPRDPPGREARQHPDRPGRQRGRHRLRHRQGGRAARPGR